MWDELMGHIGEPTEPEPTVSTDSVRAGRFNDDGTYAPDDYEHSRIGPFSPSPLPPSIQDCINSIESQARQADARFFLKEVGFVIIEEGGTSMFDAMGGTVQSDDPVQAIYRTL